MTAAKIRGTIVLAALSLTACGDRAAGAPAVLVLRAAFASIEQAGVGVTAVYRTFCEDVRDCQPSGSEDEPAPEIRAAVHDSLELVAPPLPTEAWPPCPWVTRTDGEDQGGGFLLGFARPTVQADSATVVLSRSCRDPVTVQVDQFRLRRGEGGWRVVGIERRET